MTTLLDLVAGRRGHFRLESGHHSTLWFDLDPLFEKPHLVEPLVTALSGALRPYSPETICGPLVGGAFLAQLVARDLNADFAFTERFAPPSGDGLFRVEYRLPPALANRQQGKRVAIVDDIMSAGSALRGTYADLRTYGAIPVAVGALLVLGTVGLDYFTDRGLPVEAVDREEYSTWLPADCPHCRSNVPLEEVSSVRA